MPSGRVSNQWAYLSSLQGGLGVGQWGSIIMPTPTPHNTASKKLTEGLVACKSPHYQKSRNRKWDDFCGDGQTGRVLWILGSESRSLDFHLESVAFTMPVG